VIVEEHLALRLVRLMTPEEWSSKREGLGFLFFKGGVGEYVTSPGEVQVKAGDVLIFGEGSQGKLRGSRSEEVVFWFFSLRLEHLYPLFAGREISHLQKVVASLAHSKLLPAASPLAAQSHRLIEEVPPQFDLDHRAQLLRVAAAILAEEFKMAHQKRLGSDRADERVAQIFETLSADELVNLSVSELAEKFGCGRRHLNRLFHQNFGLSVASLKMEMRLVRAAACLRNEQAKVISVAEQCGFHHLGLFNTCFKRRFGTSPGQWRKQGAEPLPVKAGHPGATVMFNRPGDAPIMAGIPDPAVRAAQASAVNEAIQKKITKEITKPSAARSNQ
jgi:AraC-like DNA-binding protein